MKTNLLFLGLVFSLASSALPPAAIPAFFEGRFLFEKAKQLVEEQVQMPCTPFGKPEWGPTAPILGLSFDYLCGDVLIGTMLRGFEQKKPWLCSLHISSVPNTPSIPPEKTRSAWITTLVEELQKTQGLECPKDFKLRETTSLFCRPKGSQKALDDANFSYSDRSREKSASMGISLTFESQAFNISAPAANSR